jgi:hypothetical protein
MVSTTVPSSSNSIRSSKRRYFTCLRANCTGTEYLLPSIEMSWVFVSVKPAVPSSSSPLMR